MLQMQVHCVWTIELGEHFVLDKDILTPLEFGGMIATTLS